MSNNIQAPAEAQPMISPPHCWDDAANQRFARLEAQLQASEKWCQDMTEQLADLKRQSCADAMVIGQIIEALREQRAHKLATGDVALP